MQVRFLLGPAGSGKTFRCLSEIRAQLAAAPEGPLLILLAPKQSTYQLERQILAAPEIPGYTRLHILSFERLAHFVFGRLGQLPPEIIDEEGRVMVLRALLARKRNDLKLFRASARLTGFAQQLSSALNEFQTHQLSPDSLRDIAARLESAPALGLKLRDLATLMQEYLDWLQAHRLQDRERLLTAAAIALNTDASLKTAPSTGSLGLHLWIDGFAELSDNECALISALVRHCATATLTFCLPGVSACATSWLSAWSVPRKTMEKCRHTIEAGAGAQFSVELLSRETQNSRFAQSEVLRTLERDWPELAQKPARSVHKPGRDLRLVVCRDRETEAAAAAREIAGFVRAGGRYRETAVLVRSLALYHRTIERVFSSHAIPFFLDQRQAVAHHPAAELTRSALRTVALGWQHEDWFAALKTGLIPAGETELDRLENEALARGWRGRDWQQPLRIRESGRTPDEQRRLDQLEQGMEKLRRRIVPPFDQLASELKQAHQRPTGIQLAAAIRGFWKALEVERQLEEWTSGAQAADAANAPTTHGTVWTQMNRWIENVELAFASDPLPVREWLAILESGLANLSVGVIPPALDQVLVGQMDRSRDRDIKLGLVLGLNEKVFPASPEAGLLLTEANRDELERCGVSLGISARQQLSRERFFAYLAFTRARSRLVLTCAEQDEQGAALYPSVFVERLRQIFPGLEPEIEVEMSGTNAQEPVQQHLRTPLPGLSREPDFISAATAERLYGEVLNTSVSRMEQFAACPFKFFVHSGLRAEERKRFELDAREQGSFRHDLLALFHEQLQQERSRWRDLTPRQARDRVAKIAEALIASYRGGLLQSDERTRFMARVMTESLQDFVEVLVDWMRNQYEFHPVKVELPFGESETQPAWTMDVGNGKALALHGRIDRVDLLVPAGQSQALCTVVDYKSSPKRLDPVLVEHGLQLQLLAYLNVLRNWPEPEALFGVPRLIPAGVFYVNLHGNSGGARNRIDALESAATARRLAYRHTGRFDVQTLRHLDSRSDAEEGDQFNYRLTKAGKVQSNCREALDPEDFAALLRLVEENLLRMGREIYSGAAAPDPFRKGGLIACAHCDYQAICRIDRWTHRYRLLRPKPKAPPLDLAPEPPGSAAAPGL